MASKFSQPGCHTNTNTNSKGKRSLVLLTDVPSRTGFVRGDGIRRSNLSPRMRGLEVKKKDRKGKKLQGRQSAILQFSSIRLDRSPVSLSSPREAVACLLSKLRSVQSRPWPAADYIKSQHPGLLVNKLHKAWIGVVPGIEVGDLFYSRAELSVVGLHRPPQAGIDATSIPHPDGDVRIAISVVLSGGYEDDVDEGETLIYTGEGGNDRNYTKRQVEDQKLEGGNLALVNSRLLQTSVRVIRGRATEPGSSKYVYSYDGLYKVDWWRASRGISNFKIFLFKLVREANQEELRWSLEN